MKDKIELLVTQASPKELSIFDVNSTIVKRFDAYYSPVDKHIQILSLGCLAEDNENGNDRITNIRTKILQEWPEHTDISGSEVLAHWMFAINKLKYEKENGFENFEVGKDCEITFAENIYDEPTYETIRLNRFERILSGKLMLPLYALFGSCMK